MSLLLRPPLQTASRFSLPFFKGEQDPAPYDCTYLELNISNSPLKLKTIVFITSETPPAVCPPRPEMTANPARERTPPVINSGKRAMLPRVAAMAPPTTIPSPTRSDRSLRVRPLSSTRSSFPSFLIMNPAVEERTFSAPNSLARKSLCLSGENSRRASPARVEAPAPVSTSTPVSRSLPMVAERSLAFRMKIELEPGSLWGWFGICR